uniref:PDZ domain-containing protein n=1 Tax=Glossina pallidipes TaxID=7398 RepID=A0A1A9ZPC8_GLOPL
MVQLNTSGSGHIHTVVLDKTGKRSFGICIVRGEVKDSPNTKTTGIFIKGIVPESPAHLCGKLKVNLKKNVRNATEQEVIELIKDAGIQINLEIQTFDKQEEKKVSDNRENGFIQNKPRLGPAPSIKQKPPNVNSLLKNTSVAQSSNMDSNYQDEDDDDTRDMTGRIRTEAGFEIDRASAGNCKLNKSEKQRDKETEDEFGYTMAKIKKRYNLMSDLRKVEITKPPNQGLGLALAGHSDRQKMACFVAGVNPNGLFSSADIKAGDEILEANGNVLKNRCHLNASVIFKNIDCDKLVLITSRRKASDDMSVRPVKRFPPEVDDTKFLFEQFPKARSVAIKKEGFLGIMIIYGKHKEVGNGIFVSDLREESNAQLAGIKVGDLLLAVNKDVTLESTYDEAVALLKRSEGIVNLVVMTLKKEEPEDEKKGGDVDKAAEKKKEEKPKEPEKPIDPATCEVELNRKTLIEVKADKKPLGVIVVGGKNNYVKTGCVITHIYPEGVLATDKRLKIFDHIVEVNGAQVKCNEITTLKVHQLFHTAYEKVTLDITRPKPTERTEPTKV